MSNELQPKNEQVETRGRVHLTKRGVMAFGTSAAVAAGIAGWGAHEVYDNLQYEDIGSTTEAISDTPIDAVKQGVNEIAKEYGFDPDEVSNKIYAGQEVSEELPTNDAGEKITVTVSENGFGKKRVSADPAEIPTVASHEDIEEIPAPAQDEPTDR